MEMLVHPQLFGVCYLFDYSLFTLIKLINTEHIYCMEAAFLMLVCYTYILLQELSCQ